MASHVVERSRLKRVPFRDPAFTRENTSIMGPKRTKKIQGESLTSSALPGIAISNLFAPLA